MEKTKIKAKLPPVRIGITQHYSASGIAMIDCSLHGQSIGLECGCCGSQPKEAAHAE